MRRHPPGKCLTLALAMVPVLATFALGADPLGAIAKNIFARSEIHGGLIVHLGCRDGALTTALRVNDSFLVQGLDTDPDNIERARAHIQSCGQSEKISVSLYDGQHLPYARNLVNAVVISAESSVAKDELLRVLSPGGVAIMVDAAASIQSSFRKPWPDEIDEWTHFLHGPDNNAVANDSVVGPPRHYQWITGPRFSRSHDHLTSVTAVVSSGGRLFSIVDEGSIAFAGASSRWKLIARDAFNGVRLWDREISNWEYHLRDFRSGPADIMRRLVAIGDRVYVTLGYGQPVVALNAADGETVRTYADTEGTREILCDHGTLLLVLGEPNKDWGAETAKQIVSQPGYRPPFETFTPPSHQSRVMAVDAGTGACLWKNSQPYVRQMMPSTLATSGGRVYFQNTDAVVCLDAADGKLRWQVPRPVQRHRLGWSTPTLVVRDHVVYSADRRAAETEGDLLWIPSGGYHQYIRGDDVQGQLIAYDAESGKRLWSGPAYEGFNAPVDVLLADGLLWSGQYAWGDDPGITKGRDPRTGEVRRQRPADSEFLPRIGHARCHRARATTNFLLLGRRGLEFVDLKTGSMVANFFVRGSCHFGYLPTNGLLYVPPHACACASSDMVKSGFIALAPQDPGVSELTPNGSQLTRGPAFQDSTINQPTRDSAGSDDWPMYRRDPSRSGATTDQVSATLQPAWQRQLGGRLTSPVIGEGMLLVAARDAHRVHALDATTGQEVWTRTADARIDSPPTIFRGRALFGSADGHVYCVRLRDGELIWRFQAAPQDRRIVVNDQLESTWPISGSVLVADDAVFFVAGRSSYLDGGMLLCKLDAATGRTLQIQKLEVDEEIRNGGRTVGGHLPDLLSADGDSIFLRSARFDYQLAKQKGNVPHLWSPVGLLDDSWWHRTYWQIGTSMSSGWGGWPKAGQQVPAGRLLVTDGSRVFGYGRNQYDISGAHVGIDAGGVWGPIGQQQGRWTFYQLFGKTLTNQNAEPSRRKAREPKEDQWGWALRVPVLVQAMVLAGNTLFIAGPVDPVHEIPHHPTDVDPLVEAMESTRGGTLMAVSTTDGKGLSRLELTSPPVFDGMAAARGHLYLSTKNGDVVCMAPAR